MSQTNISLENVIAALEACSFIRNPDCSKCYLDGPGFGFACRDQLRRDTLTLLKAQESIKARLHLCESCAKRFPDCDSDYIEFGCGFGNDNVIGCDAYTNRWVVDHDCQREYEAAVEVGQYCEHYEPTYNPEDGSL